ncbi:MAG: hypothetical protein ACE5SW_00890 [Nitrososphaeraceae archaeon]
MKQDHEGRAKIMGEIVKERRLLKYQVKQVYYIVNLNSERIRIRTRERIWRSKSSIDQI